MKNDSSRRNIPLHSRLIDLGFLSFAKEAQSGRLFPMLHERSGRYSHYVTKHFTKIKNDLGFKVPGKSFHSFRHTVINRLKQLDAPEVQTSELVGQTVDGETFGRYGKKYQVKNLKKVVEKLDFATALPAIRPWNSSTVSQLALAQPAEQHSDIETDGGDSVHASVFGRSWSKAQED
ncbi:MAG: hypothetical protein AB9919_14700 [Geobacteraceae bacterium]